MKQSVWPILSWLSPAHGFKMVVVGNVKIAALKAIASGNCLLCPYSSLQAMHCWSLTKEPARAPEAPAAGLAVAETAAQTVLPLLKGGAGGRARAGSETRYVGVASQRLQGKTGEASWSSAGRGRALERCASHICRVFQGFVECWCKFAHRRLRVGCRWGWGVGGVGGVLSIHGHGRVHRGTLRGSVDRALFFGGLQMGLKPKLPGWSMSRVAREGSFKRSITMAEASFALLKIDQSSAVTEQQRFRCLEAVGVQEIGDQAYVQYLQRYCSDNSNA